jgi:hypothetical protein
MGLGSFTSKVQFLKFALKILYIVDYKVLHVGQGEPAPTMVPSPS